MLRTETVKLDADLVLYVQNSQAFSSICLGLLFAM